MPALENLEARLFHDPSWKSEFENQLPRSILVANKIPLLHVTSDRSVIDDILRRVRGLGPSETWERRSNKTQTTEAALDWKAGPKTYYYAGRTCCEFGGIVLAFSNDCELLREGFATPFDSGGIMHGHIAIGVFASESLRSFVEKSRIEITKWRQEFAHYLAAYFSPLTSYWTGRPCHADPDGIFSNGHNQWRAWVFEICLEGLQDFSQAVAWCGSRDYHDQVRRHLVDEVPPFGGQVVANFMARQLRPGGADDYVEIMEDWSLELVEL
jgi:hypothetical protein